MEKCQQVSYQVLSCFALGLGFEEDFFTKARRFWTALPWWSKSDVWHSSAWPREISKRIGSRGLPTEPEANLIHFDAATLFLKTKRNKKVTTYVKSCWTRLRLLRTACSRAPILGESISASMNEGWKRCLPAWIAVASQKHSENKLPAESWRSQRWCTADLQAYALFLSWGKGVSTRVSQSKHLSP